MRMWMLPPQGLCRNHLLGEHFECHCLAGTYARNPDAQILKDLARYGIIEMRSLIQRHDYLAAEMEDRGYNHDWTNNPFDHSYPDLGRVDPLASYRTLIDRCEGCRDLMPHLFSAAKVVETLDNPAQVRNDSRNADIDRPVQAPQTGWQPH